MELTILEMTNKDPQFYPLMGPFLARRNIVRELGFPLWDEDDKTWFICLVDGQVAGFCAFRKDKKAIHLVSAYTLPAHRRHGVYSQLFHFRLLALPKPCHVTAMVTTSACPTFVKEGFTAMSSRSTGRYTRMERDYE